jgi:hypothetical protein
MKLRLACASAVVAVLSACGTNVVISTTSGSGSGSGSGGSHPSSTKASSSSASSSSSSSASTGTSSGCVPLGCSPGVCGSIDNGCNGVVQCSCPPPQVCAQGACCTPKSCAEQGFDCGMAADGCGNVIDCGTCPASGCPQPVCGGGGQANVCGLPAGCQPKTCAQQGYNCGMASDGCGCVLDCGTCPTGQSCGGAGLANVCGVGCCCPKTCAQLGYDCGQASDGCGGLLDCGMCPMGQSCGGGMTPKPNVCG